jgi:Chalcone isomerase-like
MIMPTQLKRRGIFAVLAAVLFLCLTMPATLRAEDTLPDSIQTHFATPLKEVGQGTYRKFGFSIYRATLWAADGVWNPQKPYALELHYTRSLSKETLVDAVTGDIRDQGVADDDTLARWEKVLSEVLPAVEDGDTIIGLHVPGKNSLLFYNETKIADIKDQKLSQAFFDIWLGEQADQDLREKLLGHL